MEHCHLKLYILKVALLEKALLLFSLLPFLFDFIL